MLTKTTIPIFFASDDTYAPFIATAIASLCYSTKEKVDVYVLDNGITSFHKKLIASLQSQFPNFTLKFIPVETAKSFKNFPLCNTLPLASYSRLLIPELEPQLKKVIYSDVDVIFLNDIAELYEQNLENYALGATYHACFDAPNSQRQELQTKLNLSKDHNYFYSGNLLLNCERWRNESIGTRIFENILRNKQQLTYGDQCALNQFFNGNNYKHLDHKFCLTTQSIIYFSKYEPKRELELRNSVVIRHFESAQKPWVTEKYRDLGRMPNFNDFWFFAQMTPFYAGLQQRFIAENILKVKNNLTGQNVVDNMQPKKSKNELFAELRYKFRNATKGKV